MIAVMKVLTHNGYQPIDLRKFLKELNSINQNRFDAFLINNSLKQSVVATTSH